MSITISYMLHILYINIMWKGLIASINIIIIKSYQFKDRRMEWIQIINFHWHAVILKYKENH